MSGGEHGGIFTGERLVAGDALFAADFARHLAAYQFVRERVRGKDVLDAGCGDGYGTDFLATAARTALGVDRASDSVAVATRRYQRPNLRYRAWDLAALADLDERFDVVCSFQVIEHLTDPTSLLKAVRAVTNPGGEFILTTPNRLQSVVENPYHVREYTGPELLRILEPHFRRIELFGVCGDAKAMEYDRRRVQEALRILRFDPFGLRHYVPRAVVERVYPALARLVRRRVLMVEGARQPVTADNFRVTSDADEALDLLAICWI